MTVQPISTTLQSLQGAASSLTGGRPENQDDFGWVDTPLGFLLVVCDGMGGGPGGKMASSLAKTTFMKAVYGSSEQADRREVLRKAVALAEDALEQKMQEVPSLRGMGTTLVSILFCDDAAYVVHLGDSRCYRLRGEKILYRSQDHSLVGELVRNKALTEEQARLSPQSNVITRGLGSTNNHVADIDEVPYQRGDRFVLCTDGVWGIMPQPGLLQRFGAAMDVMDVVNNIQTEVDRIGVSEGGNHDNHTLVIIEMNSDSRLKDKMNKQILTILISLASILLISIVLNIVAFSKLSKAPTKEDYERIMSSLSEKEQKLSVLNKYHTSTEYDRFLELEKLRADNQRLQNEISALQDSLQQATLKPIQEDVPVKITPKQTKLDVSPKDQPKKQTRPKELILGIIKRYDDLSQVNEKNTKDAISKIKKIRDDISSKLDAFGQSMDIARRTNSIKSFLPSDEKISKHIGMNRNKKYGPTETLKKAFNESKKRLEELNKDIN